MIEKIIKKVVSSLPYIGWHDDVFPSLNFKLKKVLNGKRNEYAVIVIDIQEKSTIEAYKEKCSNIKDLVSFADTQNIPVIFIEFENCGKLRSTDRNLSNAVREPIHILKPYFNALEYSKFPLLLKLLKTKKIIITGYNLNACVHLTAESLSERGLEVHTSLDTLLGHIPADEPNRKSILEFYREKTHLVDNYKKLPIFNNKEGMRNG